ncbi:DeoR family transcriptional regulator [Novosphingobium sp. PhB55]|uniref:DeoR/GlpR family DNA-binding transcription regulator n=1 Tax=Novosphingobium sp. PhB55 TaxID=2485106 RepID=UPI0010661921|nr:DeoR/GlpR family DNA-binding transcription regulator [Novosphingobium sp. PhB55]TDW60292.1 DeoR family transcriptional regulator [Novosphingobium sp. PhB55]
MTKEIPSARRELIASRLLAGEAVSSTALASEFAVSEDAVRRDLRALAAQGTCRRVYGGAVPIGAGSTPIAARLSEDSEEKRALARAAMTLISPGSFVFIDNGSTNVLAAEFLPDDAELSVATNSVHAAARLATRQDVPFVLLGGGVDLAIGGCVDGTAIEALSRLNIDLCLLGACAVSAERGASAFDAADAAFKRALVGRSRCTVVLVSNDKLTATAPFTVADLDSIDHIVLSHDAPSSQVAELERAGAKILRAAAPQAN